MTPTDQRAGADAPVPFAVLAARFCEPDETPDATVTSLRAAVETGADPGRILLYLGTLGLTPKTLDDLAAAINGLDDEEELHAWLVVEGVAVSVASDGAWHLFTP